MYHLGETKMNHQKRIMMYTLVIFFGFLAGIVTPLTLAEEPILLDEYDLLIITPTYFKKILEPLVEHKEQMQMKTLLVTLKDIYDHPDTQQGRDKAEQIKYYIASAQKTYDIQYVLLVGGKVGQLPLWHCPVRYVYMGNDWEASYLSDLYFADLYNEDGSFSDWDSDADGVFAEWVIGDLPEDIDIDLYPDVSVGRLPCRNRFEVRTMVRKIIEYETTTKDQQWFNTLVVAAGDTYPESHNPLWVGYEGEYYGDQVIDIMNDFNPIRLYTSDGTLTGTKDVVSTLNEGCGFVYLVGHGSPQTWGNHPPDADEFVKGLTVFTIPQLNNRGMYPICVVSGCHNCQYDVSLLKLLNQLAVYHGEAINKCWGWQMTNEWNGGSIATLGCTALGHTKEDKTSFTGGINELEVLMFREYKENTVQHVGDLLTGAVAAYLDQYPRYWHEPVGDILHDTWIDVQVLQSYTLLGDPSLRIGGYE